MGFDFSKLSYKAKVIWAEFTYLFIAFVLIPLAVGLQQMSPSHTFSYLVITISEIPIIILFYRIYLEKILLKKKWLLSIILLPIYLIIYELYARLIYFLIINYASFIPQSYRNNLKSADINDFSSPLVNIGITIQFFLTAFAFVMFKKIFEKEVEVQNLRYNNIKLELENLRAQIHPHFFFNTLNNLYNLSLQNSPKAPKIIEKLSNIMRYVLYESQYRVTLNKEISFMSDYFDLERIRHTKPDLIDFKVQGNIDGIEIEALLFLPLIENCFKHALQRDILENPVKIILAVDDNELTFQTNNKLLEKNESKYGGIGLDNVKKRLNLLYGDKQRLDITKDNDQFIVTVTIQL